MTADMVSLWLSNQRNQMVAVWHYLHGSATGRAAIVPTTRGIRMKHIKLNPNHYIKVRYGIIMDGIIAKCGIHAWALYSVLALFANWETGLSCPPQEVITRLTRLHSNTIREARDKLKDAGYISYELRRSVAEDGREYGHKRHFYTLKHPANMEWKNG